jgi:hypothetical protein
VADTTTVLNRLITALTVQDPTWDISVGTAEYKILEAVANEIATASNNNTLQNYSFNINTKAGIALDAYCAIFGIFRNQGKRAIGTATFYTATPGTSGGTLTVQNATGGYMTATYSGTNQTSSQITAAQINTGTPATDALNIQNALQSIIPGSNSVSVTETATTGVFTISFTPTLANGSVSFSTSNLTANSGSVVSSWVTTGGATSNYGIPTGTQIYATSNATQNSTTYFQTTAPATLLIGQNSITVPIQAVNTGSSSNLAAGIITNVSTSLTGITSVTNTATTGGIDAETDDQLRQRWQNTVFKNLAGTQDQFTALALNNSQTKRVEVLGPQTQNSENLQIQTTLENTYKTGFSNVPNNIPSTPPNFSAPISLATNLDITSLTESGSSFTISAATPSTPSSGYVKYTTSTAHGFVVGQNVTIAGVSGGSPSGGFNGTFTIVSVSSSTTFVVSNSTTGTPSYSSATAASTILTATTQVNHGLTAGTSIIINGSATTAYNVTTNVLTVPTTNTFTYSIGGNISTSAAFTISAAAASTPATGQVKYTTSATHNFSVGQQVTITGVNGGTPSGGFNGTFLITSVPSGTTFVVSNPTTGTATLSSAAALGIYISNYLTYFYTSPYNSSIGSSSSFSTSSTSLAAQFAPGQFVSIEGIAESGALSTTNSFNTTGIITAITPPSGNSNFYSFVIPNVSTTIYISGGTASLVPNSATASSTANFSIYPSVTLSATWTVSQNNGIYQAIVSVPSGVSTSGIIVGQLVISGTLITQAMGATVTAINGNTITVTASNYNYYTMQSASSLTSITFSIPTNAYIANATTSGTYITYTTNTQNSAFQVGQTVTVSNMNNGNSFFSGWNVTNATITSAGYNTFTVNAGIAPTSYTAVTVSAATPSTPSTGYVQYTTSSAHGLVPGQSITIAGITPSGYSGSFIITSVPDSTHFVVSNATTGTATLSSATVTTSSSVGGTASLVINGNTTIANFNNYLSNLYNSAPISDSTQVVTVSPFYNNATLTITGAASGNFTVNTNNSAASPISLPYNVNAVGANSGSYTTSNGNLSSSIYPSGLPSSSSSNINITAASPSSGVVTYTTSSNHNYVVGQIVNISGISGGTPNGGYSGTFTITATPTTTTFQVSNSTTGTPTIGSYQTIFVATGIYVATETVYVPATVNSSGLISSLTLASAITLSYPLPKGSSLTITQTVATSSGSSTYTQTFTTSTSIAAGIVTVIPINQQLANYSYTNAATITIAQSSSSGQTYVQGLQDALNSLLKNYGIQSSVYRTAITNGYQYSIDFYSISYEKGIGVNGVISYYWVPIESSYVSKLLTWNFPSTWSAAWSVPSGQSGTISQLAAANILFSHSSTVPLSYSYSGTGTSPYALNNSIATSIPNATYFYPMGLESISGIDSNGVSSFAIPNVDYTYNNNIVSPSQAIVNIVNGSNNDLLYPGNILEFIYYYVDGASRNSTIVPTTSTNGITTNTAGPTVYTNYVDVIIDGVNSQLVTEDGAVNTNVTVASPGAGGTITSSNNSNWVLGDLVTNPPVGDVFYNFSQQPVIQPWPGVFPNYITMGSFTRTDSSCTWSTSIPSNVWSAGTSSATMTSTGINLNTTAYAGSGSMYTNITVTSTISSNYFMYGPATFQLTSGSNVYTVWYSSYQGSVFYDCVILNNSTTTSISINASSTISQVSIADTNVTLGDIGAIVTGNNSDSTNAFTGGYGIITSVDPGRKFVISTTVTESSSGPLAIENTGTSLYPYSGPVSKVTPTNSSLLSASWLSAGNELYPSSDIFATAVSNSAQDPSLTSVSTQNLSSNLYSSGNLAILYKNMAVNIPNIPFPSYIESYNLEQGEATFYGQFANAYSGTTTPNTNISGITTNYPNNTVFASDFYPIYDNTSMSGSTLALNGIGIRQPTPKTRYATWTSGQNFINDTSAIASDLGCFVVDNNSSPVIPPQAYITQVIPGVGYYITYNMISYNSNTLQHSSSTLNQITLIPFSTMPLFGNRTTVSLSGVQYSVNAAVKQVDSLIQQQRLLGTSVLTHGASFMNLLINLVIVPGTGINSATLPSQIQVALANYINNLSFSQPLQINNIVSVASSVNGVVNARIASANDSILYYGIQEINPYLYYDSITDVFTGGASTLVYTDLEILGTYTGDIELPTNTLPQLLLLNVYVRSESDF